MKLLLKFLLSIQILTIFVSCSNKYCNPELCRSGKHIGCDNNGEINGKCAAHSTVLNISHLKDDILDWHNEKRHMIAAGEVENFGCAARMGTMIWDDELEYLAGLNVKTCEFDHDDCRNCDRFKHSGQNLAYWGGNYEKNITIVIKDAIDDWFEECKDATPEDIHSYVSGRSIGHFTVIVNDRNTFVGCAILEQDLTTKTKYHFACNYATTNIIHCPVYEEGEPASKCTKINKKYPCLCDESEDIDCNKTC